MGQSHVCYHYTMPRYSEVPAPPSGLFRSIKALDIWSVPSLGAGRRIQTLDLLSTNQPFFLLNYASILV